MEGMSDTKESAMSDIKRYRKRPVEIEAVQLGSDNAAKIAVWIGSRAEIVPLPEDAFGPGVRVHTMEGAMLARPSDWIIRGVEGEFYPCVDSVFAATYDPVA